MQRSARTNFKTRAAKQYAEWRAAGVPTLITQHEAWQLTGGAVGKYRDHGASGGINLSTVALLAAKR